MALEIATVSVTGVRAGATTALTGGVLTVDTDGLAAELKAADERLAQVAVHIVEPGSSTRLCCVKDVLQPRIKAGGGGLGEGRLLALEGVVVTTLGQIVGFQEGLIDMSGPGADYSPFGAMWHVAVEASVVEGCAPHDHEAALREAGVRAMRAVAEAARAAEPASIRTVDTTASLPQELPRVVYVYPLLTQGLLHDTWLMGENCKGMEPRLVGPELISDDAIVSGNCVSACDKNTTWHHQNNPIVRALLARHGVSLNFAGVVLTPEPTRLAEKEAAASAAVALAAGAGARGAIISKEGFGNPDADLMMLARGLERSGIRTVCVTDEYAGSDGASQSLADTTPEADAVVSTGNANARITLPAMERVLGPSHLVPKLAGSSADTAQADGGLVVELQALIGATNELGAGRLRCEEL